MNKDKMKVVVTGDGKLSKCTPGKFATGSVAMVDPTARPSHRYPADPASCDNISSYQPDSGQFDGVFPVSGKANTG
jgi:hypothetical protein